MVKWQYQGDMNLECGGFFWRQENPNDDFVEIVEVVPDSDHGGADNVFHIAIGSVYLGVSDEKKKAALDCLGWLPPVSEAPLSVLVDALRAYSGMEVDDCIHVRIGQIDPMTQDATMPEDQIHQIRGNWKLKSYVKHYAL